jgi:4,5-DOPA dioxygenase extradiol
MLLGMSLPRSIFIGHGSPMLAIDDELGAPFVRWGAALGKPSAVLMVSAHWEAAPPTLGTVSTLPLIYDFGGFPAELSRVRYAAPGAPELADQVAALLVGEGVRRDPRRGLDHGVWTPLVHMYPDADVPVLQLSLPSAWGAARIFAIGQKLAALSEQGVLLAGSGNITHNLRALAPEGSATPAWAADFEAWARRALLEHDVDSLLAYKQKAPNLRMNHPTEDHWLPLFFALGAAHPGSSELRVAVDGWQLGTLSKLSVAFC